MNVRALLSKTAAAVALASLVATSSASAATSTWNVDAVHSAVIFKIRHFGAGNTWGRFNDFKGTIVLDDAEASKSTVTMEIKTASVDTGNADRDAHLRSPDFFNAAQFPTITFASTKVEASGADFQVTGDLTLHGVKKSITVKITKIGEGKGMKGESLVGFEGTFTIKRSEYDVKGYLPNIGDDVTLTLAIEAIKG